MRGPGCGRLMSQRVAPRSTRPAATTIVVVRHATWLVRSAIMLGVGTSENVEVSARLALPNTRHEVLSNDVNAEPAQAYESKTAHRVSRRARAVSPAVDRVDAAHREAGTGVT